MKDVDQLLGIQKPIINREKIKDDSDEVQKTKNALLLLLRNLSRHNAIITSPEKNDGYKKSNFFRIQQNMLVLQSWTDVKKRLKELFNLNNEYFFTQPWKTVTH